MLTLPMQAMAYVAMQACVLSEPDASMQTTHSMAMAGDAMASCHEMADAESLPAQHPSTQHDCKFCAACGLASALPADVAVRMPVIPMPQAFSPQPAAAFSGFFPDGPERPPRAVLA